MDICACVRNSEDNILLVLFVPDRGLRKYFSVRIQLSVVPELRSCTMHSPPKYNSRNNLHLISQMAFC